MGKKRLHHLNFTGYEGYFFIVCSVSPAGPGGGVAVYAVNGHWRIQKTDFPVQGKPESNGVIRKAVRKGNTLKIRRMAHPVGPADDGTGMKTKAHATDYGGERNITVTGGGEKEFIRLIAFAEVIPGIVNTGGIFRMGIQKSDLSAKFGGIGPVIVPLAVSDIFPTGIGIHHGFIDVDALGEKVFLLMEEPDNLRIALLIFPENGSGAVGGGIIRHQNLERKVSVLGKKTVQRIADVFFVIISCTVNGNFTMIAHGHTPDLFDKALYTEKGSFSIVLYIGKLQKKRIFSFS